MKKLAVLLMTLVCAVALSACGAEDPATTPDPTTPDTGVTEPVDPAVTPEADPATPDTTTPDTTTPAE